MRATWAPAAESWRASSAPMPLAAPVITVVFPVRLSRGIHPPRVRIHSGRCGRRRVQVFFSQEVVVGRNADAIAEGVAIATAAARLMVKNHILVGTIARG